MKVIKYLTLIFALCLWSAQSFACWDDAEDDYWDDDDDWYYEWYYDWFYDDDEEDDDSIWLDEVIVIGNSDDNSDDSSDYDWDDDDDWDSYWDDGSIWLDEVIVTYEPNYLDDDDWLGDYDDYYCFWDQNSTTIGYGDASQEKDDNDDAKTKNYIKQSCSLCCVPAVMAIMNQYAKNISIDEAKKLETYYKDKYNELTNHDIVEDGIHIKYLADYLRKCGFTINQCSVESIASCTDNGYQVFLYIDVHSEDGDVYGHALDVIHSNRDNDGNVVSYDCINPLTGNIETHNSDEFNHPFYVYCIKNIK